MDPIGAAARLAGLRGRVLLHSGRDDDGLGRYSFVAAEPCATLISRGHSIVETDATGHPTKRYTADPFDAVEAFLAAHGCAGVTPGDPAPRAIGYFGYDLARVVEKLPGGPTLGHDTPDLWLGVYDAVARWSPDGSFAIVGDNPARLERLLAGPAKPIGIAPSFGPFVADDDAAHHVARVERIKDYLVAGDVYQVNLARRLVARERAPGDALAVYAALAATSPAPYGALIEADGATVISGSPERYLASVDDRVETRPIKGTRAIVLGESAGADTLSRSTKDGAEHLMIVDLERNDLGKIAELGSVTVDRFAYVVELPRLYHMVSRVSARARPSTGYAALLRATFPGGSITGAPKVRAMQLIDELEPARRGPYCGALGYFGPTGFDLAIAIRIGVLAGGELRVHVGGGIVADSVALDELAETETKAAGWIAALDALSRQRE